MKLNTAGQSVVVVANGRTFAALIETLFLAQQTALHESLPLAVVEVVDRTHLRSRKTAFQRLEQQLTVFDIPLIVLLGEKEEMLANFYHHVMPFKIFEADTTAYTKKSDTLVLVTHPYGWPGTIIPVEKLVELHDSEETC